MISMTQESGQTINILSTTLKQIADNVMITNRQGIIEYVNPAFEKTTGYTSQEAIGQNPRILRSGQHKEDYYHSLWETILAGKVFRATTTNKKKNGDIYYADQTISPVVNEETGEIICFVSVWKDITERIVAQQKLKEANQQLIYEKKKLEQVLAIEAGLHSILDLHKLIDFVVNKTCEVLEAEKCSIMFVDHETGELCLKGHRGMEDLEVTENPLRMGDGITDLIERRHKAKTHDHSPRKHSSKIDGTFYQSETFLSVPIELKDHLLGIINVSHKKGPEGAAFTDLDLKILFMIVRQVRIAIENARLYRQLKYLTITDPMTGIYNYRHFVQTLDYEISRSKRYERNLSFLMIDVDKFKNYNDSFGHLEGDQLLKSIAKAIQQNVRESDVVCRYAGDEFAVILPEADAKQAGMVAEKIRKTICALAAKLPVSVSIGVAQCSLNSDRYDLIQKADSHLYTVKRQEKNQVPLEISKNRNQSQGGSHDAQSPNPK